MRITRLYHPEKLTCGKTICLDAESSAHLVRVLRTRAGSKVILFNGDGSDYLCRTVDANPKKTLISIESSVATNNESALETTLIQGLSRHDRMDQTIQKSVELGVNRIIPVLCQRSNSKLHKDKQDKKLAHWKKVAISACEQAGRSIIPEITEVTSIEDIDQLLTDRATKFILNPTADGKISDIETRPGSVEIFIGPEGGMNEDEIGRLAGLHFHEIRFGPRILRTETAGPAVLSVVQSLWGDI